MKCLEFHNVSFSYPHNKVIENACFEIEEKKLIGIVGPNGGGKTTLLKLIMGFLDPSSGSIKIYDKKPKEKNSLIGYVPQIQTFDPLFPITVLEVVLQGAVSYRKFLRKLDPIWTEKALKLLDQLGLSCKVHANFFSLSGGQAQRVLIARALLTSPKILILDEPTSNIDKENEKILFNLLMELKKEITILMVSHNLPSLAKEIDEALLVNKNVCKLKPDELCQHYSLGLFHPPIQINRP